MERPTETRSSRRTVLRYGMLVGSAGLYHSAFGGWVPAALAESGNRDVTILHAALYLEHEAIAAYEAGAASGLLSKEVLSVAAAFMEDHKYHRDGIAGAIKTLGDAPDPAKSGYRFGALRTADDILKLALQLESGAATAYRTLASSVQNRTVLGFAAHILADEVRHMTVLRTVLKLPTY